MARAQVAEGLSLASGAKTAVAEYFNTNGTFPADNTEAGLSDAGTITGNYVESVTVSVADGKALITALFSSTEAHSKIQGGEMTLTAVDHAGSIAFACTSTGSIDITAYLPSSCRGLTGPAIPASPSVPFDGTPWADLTPDERDSTTACWNATNNRWEAGTNDKPITNGGQQQLVRDKATLAAPDSCFPAARPCNCKP